MIWKIYWNSLKLIFDKLYYEMLYDFIFIVEILNRMKIIFIKKNIFKIIIFISIFKFLLDFNYIV
jgi:hypothetical protein